MNTAATRFRLVAMVKRPIVSGSHQGQQIETAGGERGLEICRNSDESHIGHCQPEADAAAQFPIVQFQNDQQQNNR